MHQRMATDFAAGVLDDLYAYRMKRRSVAWLLWAVLGIVGGHRFYVQRPGTGVLMMFTGGGALVWWIVDGWRVPGMVREYNAEQSRRQAAGEPPVELAFLPARGTNVLEQPPAWLAGWEQSGRGRRVLRFAGDVLVLLICGASLGAIATSDGGGMNAMFAVIALIAVTMLGGYAGMLDRVPLLHALLRWTHRLRLFYYFNKPGSPLSLMVRGLTVMVLAPFRRRDRAEVRMYLELGAAFTAIFVAMDVLQNVALPLISSGIGALSFTDLLGEWIEQGVMTFIVTYAFAAPVGAILTLYLLTRPSHLVPRLLGAFTLLCIALGAGLIG